VCYLTLGVGGTLGRPGLFPPCISAPHPKRQLHSQIGLAYLPISISTSDIAPLSARMQPAAGAIAFFAFSKHGARQAQCLSHHAFGSLPESECLERSCHFVGGLGNLLAERWEWRLHCLGQLSRASEVVWFRSRDRPTVCAV
jgi:hypothetical protein